MAEPARRARLLAFAGVLAVLFLASLNFTVVGTALPRIVAELEGVAFYAWAFTVFSLTSTVSLPLYGKLSDVYGRRVVMLFGIALFTASSLLIALSQDMLQLVLFRGVQGLGAGALFSMSFAVIGELFTPRERGKYQGLTSSVFGLSAVVGPIIGGLITDAFGWRWVFLVNLPVALVAFALIYRNLPTGLRQPGAKVDYAGALLLTAGVVPLLLALTWGGVDHPWGSPFILGLLAASGLMLWAFAWWQTRAPSPILEPGLFRDLTFNVANASGFLAATGLFAAVIYLPLFVQGVQGGSAASSGLVLTPLMGGLVLSSTLAGLLVSRTGRYKPFIVGGSALSVVALLLTATLDVGAPPLLVVLYMLLLGIGIGPTNSLFVLAVQNAMPAAQLGVVTGANQFFRQMGGTLGVAVFGAFLASSLRRGAQLYHPREVTGLPAELAAEAFSPNLLTNPVALEGVQAQIAAHGATQVFAPFLSSMRAALGAAIGEIFIVATALSLLAFLIALALPERVLRDTPRDTPQSGEPLPAASD
ncbi:MDR family MFS transporter [soil metagenome]